MFRPATMMRLRAVVLQREERSVLCELGRLGVLHLTTAPAMPDNSRLVACDRSPELARWNEVSRRVGEIRKMLGIPPRPDPTQPSELPLAEAEQRLAAITARVDAIMRRQPGLLQRLGESAAIDESVSRYRGLNLPLDPADEFSFLHFVTGTLPAANLGMLREVVGENVALLPLPEQQGRRPLVAMTTRPGRSALESVLRQAGFQADLLPVIPGATADTLAESNQREQQELAVELERVEAERQACAVACAPALAELEQLAQLEGRLLEADQHFLRTAAAVLITGWVPADDVPALRDRFHQITDGRGVIDLTPPSKSASEKIPVLLRHPWWLRPFGALVRAYGLPDYAELEPTVFVALSYLLMFGLMFGDVGHGAVLAVGGLIALRLGRTGTVGDLGWLMLFAGLSAMGFGWVYGSCFGLEAFKPYALWHDPLEGDPITLLYGAIGIGFVMISLGLILNIINHFRRGDVIGGLLDKFGLVGVLFYWGVLALITKYAAIEARGLVNLAIILFLGLPLAGWALRGPLEYFVQRQAGPPVGPGGGVWMALAESLVGAFEAVLSYLANTISFVRLAAYAMSHAALLVAIFTLAAELKRISVGGGFLSVLVIILGNLGVIVLEAVIASVQALRLEYYEFFSKFFSGSGLAFAPFQLPRYDQAPAGLDFGVVGCNKVAAGPAAGSEVYL